MRGAALVPIVLLSAGAGLLIAAIVQGGAVLALVLIVPVVAGRSLEFVAGVLLVIVGLFTLPLALDPIEERERLSEDTAPAGPIAGAGGLVLIGPVPIFFGRWTSVSTRTRVIVAVLGGIALVAAIVVVVLAVG